MGIHSHSLRLFNFGNEQVIAFSQYSGIVSIPSARRLAKGFSAPVCYFNLVTKSKRSLAHVGRRLHLRWMSSSCKSNLSVRTNLFPMPICRHSAEISAHRS